MKKTLLGGFAAILIPMAVMAQSVENPSATAPNGLSPASDSTMMSAQDRMFIEKAGQSGQAEVTDGQLAETQGDAAVKQVGQMLVTDHTKANDQLTSVSAEIGYVAPKNETTQQSAKSASLTGLSTAAFDRAYLKEQVKAHETAIALFKKEAAIGENAQLKQFAVTTLPVLEKHLAMVKAAMGR
jgi:putative membrane protein